MNVSGSGLDNIAAFTIDGTGGQSQNFGHEVIIQLTWNEKNNKFEGDWYVQTKKYYGEDKFQLKFDEQQQLRPYEKV
ncbi:unnamed protein product [Adineta steineri]|uniref:Uncharacterized protein n=1 Tax=Adineta steineri TaxID=433720 RepID=A0A815TFD5_9BILA|nr:unnamed protein product [Adineta steineri]CAF3706818.1 unnamed protein product [Adineta steineri]